LEYLSTRSSNALARQVEIYALKAQMNPHFLFNTLNTGMQLAIVEGADGFALAGGVATPADAALLLLLLLLGAEAVFVGSGIFKSKDPARRAKAIVEAVTHYKNPEKLAEISTNLGEPMMGINFRNLAESEQLAGRGW
jgi:pyridoxal biosynthesis lyase PdxS